MLNILNRTKQRKGESLKTLNLLKYELKQHISKMRSSYLFQTTRGECGGQGVTDPSPVIAHRKEKSVGHVPDRREDLIGHNHHVGIYMCD